MLIYRKWAALLGLVLAVMAGLAHADNRPEVAEKVLAYAGAGGVKVWTLRIGARSDNQALVQVEGVDHDWNLKIQKMTVEKTAKDTRYSTRVDGQKFVVLVLQQSWGELYLPGEAQALSIGYDESLSSQGNAQAFLTDYLQAN
ncbi:hypothetical protein JBE38_24245 [Pseudomonas sp. ICBG1301]|uniref:Uncharacterized protein n=1 Tax=Pseudomonas palleroniana TaxID=191390 RepID=A0A120EAB7_9PSED|nr:MULTISPECIES: hypothetical protein [Pseudomonas]RUQ46243.1 hypothetical protein D8M30_14570 [Corynebacterium pseudodiphtheriticum]AVE04276.1 hypothetical protein CYL20_06870 [Pseudomonas palleroniana]KWU52546.1 hypothetical protein AWV77_01405 [Pseudomonas palleroniana]MBM9489052.1 hypothetical protein [Pseudomonas sp. ICBG1301]UOK35744.1 hypothetical protein MJP36_14545 [Pseudomonas palleroniana]